MMNSTTQRRKKVNAFHLIRQREFSREYQMMLQQSAGVRSSYFTPSLTELCARQIARDFNNVDINAINTFDETLKKLITEMLPTNLELSRAVGIMWPLREVDEYWRHRSEATWSAGLLMGFAKKYLESYNNNLALNSSPAMSGGGIEFGRMRMSVGSLQFSGGGRAVRSGVATSKSGNSSVAEVLHHVGVTWKQFYLERYLEEFLMQLEIPHKVSTFSSVSANKGAGRADSGSNGGPSQHLVFAEEREYLKKRCEEELLVICQDLKPYIHRLHLDKQRTHVDLVGLLSNLPNLIDFKVSYGVLNAGVDYVPEVIGISRSDTEQLKAVLRTEYAPYISRLSLPENAIDDDLCRMIVGGLVENRHLFSLDLSHNRISDAGAAALGTVMMQPCLRLKTLDLSDNDIRSEGARMIGDALAVNNRLTWLSLRMNRLGDVGGEAIFGALRYNDTLSYLDLSNNEVGLQSVRALGLAASERCSLITLNLYCNSLGEYGGAALIEAAEASRTIIHLDVRESYLTSPQEEHITTLMKKRKENYALEIISAQEAVLKEQIQKEVRVKIKKTHGVVI